jgi:soluble lytic murein transglycosylase-like protein
MAWTSLAVVALTLFHTIVNAEVYKYRDRAGRTYLTDQPMQGDYALVKVFRFDSSRRTTGGAAAAMRAMGARREALAPKIAAIALETGLNAELIHAVVRAESAYQATAVSPKGAVGLMQLMPATAARYGVTNRRDPEQNLRGGASYLRELLQLFDQDLRLALAAYNAGEKAVIAHDRSIPPYRETRRYVEKVLQFYESNRRRAAQVSLASN